MVEDLNKCFIGVHTLIDGCVCSIRTDCIEAVMDCKEERLAYGVKPNHTCIDYAGHSVDVIESYATIMDMIWKSEL